MSKLKMGLNKDISNTDYHADRNFLSSSALKLLLRDKRQFCKKYIKGEADEVVSSSAMDLGSYIHSLILEPDLTDTEFAVYTGTKRGKDWEAFKKNNESKIIVSRSQKLSADSAVENFFSHEKISELIAIGTPERTLCVEMNGVPIKVRKDFFNGAGNIIDLKTTSAPLEREALASMICRRDYDLSAALYVDAARLELGWEPDFYLVFLSTKLPADTVAYKVGTDLLENGRRKYRKALEIYKQCKLDNSWEDDIIDEIHLPPSERFE